MPSNFPTSADNVAANKANASVASSDHPGHHNTLAEGLNAVQAYLLAAPVIMTGSGIDPTGLTDSSTAIQAKLDALPSTGGCVIFPAGTYLAANLTLDQPTMVLGVGTAKGYLFESVTRIICPSASGDLFTVNSDGCTFENVTLQNTAVTEPTAGAGIHVADGNFTRLRNVMVAKFYDNVKIDTGWWGKITDCFFTDQVRYGVLIRNQDYYDDGDWVIHGSDFAFISTDREADAHVRFESGGAFRFTGNKLNGNAKLNGAYPGTGNVDIGLDFCMDDGGGTSGLVIVGNSLEVARTAVIRISQKGPAYTGNVGQAMISGNNITFAPYGVWVGANADNTDVSEVVISDNVFKYISFHSIYAQYMTGLTIGPNEHAVFTPGSDLIVLGPNADAAGAVRQWRVAQQNLATDGQYLLYNPASLVASHDAMGQARLEFERQIPATTSSVTYTTLYRMSFADYSAGVLELVVAANVSGLGGGTVLARRTYTRGAGGNVTATAIGADATAGAVFDVLFDTTSVAGEVQVKIRLNAGAGGTDITGLVALRIDGPVLSIKKGA